MKFQKIARAVLALLLICTSVITLVPSASAATTLPFKDVSKSDWFYHAVEVCYNDGTLAGTSQKQFSPNVIANREMIAMVVFRLTKGTQVPYKPYYEDVPDGKWYTNAIVWDTMKGYTSGIGNNMFGLGRHTTKQEVMTFLYRVAGSPTGKGDLSVFADASSISGWATNAYKWAVGENIVTGETEAGKRYLKPTKECTRAELAQILMCYNHPEERVKIGSTPSTLNGAVTINGIKLPNIYAAAGSTSIDKALMKATDIKKVWSQATIATTESANPQCIIKIGSKSFTYTIGSNGTIYDGINWYVPYKDFPVYYGYHKYTDTVENHVFYTPIPIASKIQSGRKVPILMYHAVDDQAFAGGVTELFVTPANMEAQLKYIKDHGYSAIWFEDLANLSSYSKPVILTFDDGYKNMYTKLFPLLKKYNIKATIFIFPMNIGTTGNEVNRNFLTWEMIDEMQKSGLVSFQSHTMTHRNLDSLTKAEQKTELEESKRIITERTGKECFVLCYPSGKYNNTTLTLAKDSYQFGIKMNGNLYTTGTNAFLIPRYYISRYTSLSTFAAYISNAK